MTAANLPPGTLLQAGTAVLRVTDMPNDGCAKWKVRYGEAASHLVAYPAHAALRLCGILCAVWQDGEVALDGMLTVQR